MNILLIPIGERNRASSRFRVWQMTPLLEEIGHTCKVIPYIRTVGANNFVGSLLRKLNSRLESEKEISKYLDWADIIYLQETLPSRGLIAKIRASSSKVIFDFSDPIHLESPLARSWLSSLYFRAVTKPSFESVLKISDSVVVENDSLVDICEKQGCKTYVMRGPIDCSQLQPKDHKSDEQFVIGWTGSPSTFHFIEHIFPWISQLANRSAIKVIFIGSGKESVVIPGVDVQCVDWNTEAEKELIPQFDLGLFSLGQSAWDKSRGGGKLFVYMSAGVPFVAPNIGIAAQVFSESGAGIIFDGKNDWIKKVDQLIQERERQKTLAKTARAFASKHYSREACLDMWRGF